MTEQIDWRAYYEKEPATTVERSSFVTFVVRSIFSLPALIKLASEHSVLTGAQPLRNDGWHSSLA